MKKAILVLSLIFSYMLASVAFGGGMDIGLKGIGGGIGLVLPEGESDATFGLAVVADMGTIMPQLRAEASVDYWGNSWDLIGVETSWSTITIGGTVKYDFPFEANYFPFVGGGLGLAISRWKTEWKADTWGWGATPSGSTSDSDTDIAFHFVGGVDIPVGSNMKFTAQAKYVMDGYDAIWLTGILMVQLD